MHCNKTGIYSITSAAGASSSGGTVSPSALAVLRLMTKSSFVGNSTGKVAGEEPLEYLHDERGCPSEVLTQVNAVAKKPARDDSIAHAVDIWRMRL
jgi:hypothetical protein